MRCFLSVYFLCDVENFHENIEVDTSLDRIGGENISLSICFISFQSVIAGLPLPL